MRDSFFKIIYSVVCLVLLSGCSGYESLALESSAYSYDSQDRSVQKDNAATSSEYRPGTGSPLEQHLWAKKQVNPRDLNRNHNYTLHNPVPPEYAPFEMRIVPPAKPDPEKPARLASARTETDSTYQRKMMPARKTLIVSESDLPKITQPSEPKSALQKIDASRVKTHSAPKQEAASPQSGQGAIVQKIRIGQHADKTRFVFDLSRATDYSFNLDGKARVLLIKIPEAQWADKVAQSYSRHAFLDSYSVKHDHNGDLNVAIAFKKPAKVIFNSAYKPGDGRGDRLVFDVAPLPSPVDRVF